MSGGVRTASPRDLTDLASLTCGYSGQIAFIAGGTDLIIKQSGMDWPGLVVDLTRLSEIGAIRVSDTMAEIGAATSLTAVAAHPVLNRELPVLTQAAAQVGSVQIRNRATIGGNLASAVPAGDLLPVLKCLDCRVEIRRRDGSVQRKGFDELVVGQAKTSLANGDLIARIAIPLRHSPNRASAFAKIGLREVLTIARLNLAAVADFDREARRINDIRLVAGAIGPVPLRLDTVETVLRGRVVGQQLADDALQALVAVVDNTIRGRRSRPYKRRAIAGLGLDLLQGLFGRAFEPPHEMRFPA